MADFPIEWLSAINVEIFLTEKIFITFVNGFNVQKFLEGNFILLTKKTILSLKILMTMYANQFTCNLTPIKLTVLSEIKQGNFSSSWFSNKHINNLITELRFLTLKSYFDFSAIKQLWLLNYNFC